MRARARARRLGLRRGDAVPEPRRWPRCRAERGDLAGARAALALPGFPEAAELPPTARGCWSRRELRVLLAEGRRGGGAGAGRRSRATLRRDRPQPGLAALALGRAPRRCDRLGRADEAQARRGRRARGARGPGARPATVGAVAARARRRARREDGLADLEEAVALLEGTPERLELAKALAALGTAMRLARRPTDAREPLRRALELADRVRGRAAGRARPHRAARGGRAPAPRRRSRAWSR